MLLKLMPLLASPEISSDDRHQKMWMVASWLGLEGSHKAPLSLSLSEAFAGPSRDRHVVYDRFSIRPLFFSSLSQVSLWTNCSLVLGARGRKENRFSREKVV